MTNHFTTFISSSNFLTFRPINSPNISKSHNVIRCAQTPSKPSKSKISTNSEPASIPDETNLRKDHLSAYFSADDSQYQPRLSPAPMLALRNFLVELEELQITIRRAIGIYPPLQYTPPDCLNLKLNAKAVANRERKRQEKQGEIKTSWFVTAVYKLICVFLDIRFEGRPIPKFWFLETVARMPYFAYSSCLHLLSTLGWFRSPTLMNMHHAEELNEAYHLAVMESLGGDKRWGDRFLAFHSSIIYYWCLIILFFISPTESYRFSELLEGHAVDTYAQFLQENEDVLKTLPVPDVAYEYFSNFLYYFYEFQLTENAQENVNTRKPKIDSLYDVFQNILEDEIEHTRTMGACMRFIEKGDKIWFNGNCVSAGSRTATILPTREREEFWKNWSNLREQQNNDDK